MAGKRFSFLRFLPFLKSILGFVSTWKVFKKGRKRRKEKISACNGRTAGGGFIPINPQNTCWFHLFRTRGGGAPQADYFRENYLGILSVERITTNRTEQNRMITLAFTVNPIEDYTPPPPQPEYVPKMVPCTGCKKLCDDDYWGCEQCYDPYCEECH